MAFGIFELFFVIIISLRFVWWIYFKMCLGSEIKSQQDCQFCCVIFRFCRYNDCKIGNLDQDIYTCINNLKYFYSFIKKNMVDNLLLGEKERMQHWHWSQTSWETKAIFGKSTFCFKKCNMRGELLKFCNRDILDLSDS
jgi:hypothetical protein